MAHFNVCTTQANFYDHYLTVVVAAELFWPLTFLLKLFSAVNVNYFSQWGRDWVLVCLSAGGGKHSTVCLNIVDNFNSRWPEYQIISSVNNQSAATCHQSRVPQPGMGERGPRSTLSTWIWRNNVWSPTETHPSSFLSQICDKLESCCVPETLHQPFGYWSCCIYSLQKKKQLFVLLTSKLKRANMVCNFV